MWHRALTALAIVAVVLSANASAGEMEPTTLWVDRASIGGACDDARTADEARSASTPWCTLERAEALAPDGSEVRVRAGTYPELRLRGHRGRIEPVTFRAHPDETVQVDGLRLRATSKLRFEGFRLIGPTSVGAGATSIALTGNEVALTEPAAAISLGVEPIDGEPTRDIVIEDNDIHDVRSSAGNGTAGYGIRAGSRVFDVRISGNRLSRIQVDAIQLSGGDIVIEDNVISDVDKRDGSDSHSDPMQILRGERITIRRNFLHDNAHAVLIHAGVLGVVVERNVIARTRNYALKLGDSPGARIVGNTTWDNELGGMTISDDEGDPLAVDGVVLANNILDGLDVDDEVGFAFAGHNLYRTSPQGPDAVRGPQDVYDAGPRFMDREMLDFRPSAVSPAVDRAAGDHASAGDQRGVAPYDDPGVPDTGTGAVPYGDVGALERDPTLPDPDPPPALRVAGDLRFVLPPAGVGRRVLRVFNGTDETQEYSVQSSGGWLVPAARALRLEPRATAELTAEATAGATSPANEEATLTVAGGGESVPRTASLLVRRAHVTEPAGAVRVDADRLAASPVTVDGAADPGEQVRLQAIGGAGAGEPTLELGSAAAAGDGRWSAEVAGPLGVRGDHFALRAVPADASASDAASYPTAAGRLLASRFGARHPDVFGGRPFSDVSTESAALRGIQGIGDGLDELWLYAGAGRTEATMLPSWGLQVGYAAGAGLDLVEDSHTGGWTGDTAEVRETAVLADGEPQPTTVERRWAVGAGASHARVTDTFHNGGTAPRTYRLSYPVVAAAPGRDTEYQPSTFARFVGDADYDARGGREVGWTFAGGSDAPREGFVLSRHERSTGDDPAFGHNVVVWHRRPASVASADQARARLELEYLLTIPPGDTEEVVHDLGSTRSDAAGAELASALYDTRGPELEVDAPVDGPVTTGRSVMVTGRAQDESSPVEVTVAGTPVTVGAAGAFESQVPLPDDDGPMAIAIAAVDGRGHRTEVVRRLHVDRGEAPETSFVSGPEEITSETAAHVELAASVSGDPLDGAGFECSLDGAAWTQCAAVFELADLGEGDHELRARAVTGRGRIDLTPARHAWTVDVTPPGAFAGLLPAADALMATGAPALSWEAAAGAARYELWLDDARAAETTATGWTPPSGLTEGAHRWHVRAFDTAGNERRSSERAFTVDTTPPAAFELATPTEQAALATPRPALGWDAPGDAARCEAWLDGAFAGTAMATFTPIEELAEGLHAWHVRCFDLAGNERRSSERTFTVDVTPPATFALTAPVNDAELSTRRPALGWAAAAGAARYEVWLDDTRATETTATTWTPPDDFAEGAHRWHVRAFDAAGNERRTSERTFTVDLTPPPAFALAVPAHEAAVASRRPVLSWDAPAGAARCEAWLDGAFAGAGAASFTPAEDLTEGAHAWHVRCFDAAGNERRSSERTFTVDVTPPAAFTLSAPADEAALSSRRPTLTWAASAGATACEVSIDDQLAGTAMTSFTPAQDLAEGPHAWQVRCVDAAGNERLGGRRTFTVDVTPPAAFELVAPADEAELPTPRPALSWQPSAGAARYEVWLDGARTTQTAGTSWTPPADLGDGAHRWQIRAYDSAGNERRSAERAFSVDTTPPEPTPTATPEPTSTPTPTPTPTSTATPVLRGGASPAEQAGQLGLQETAHPRPGFRSVRLKRLGPGRYRARVRLTAAAAATVRIVATRRPDRRYRSRAVRAKAGATVMLQFALPPGTWRTAVRLLPATGPRTPVTRTLGRLKGAKPAAGATVRAD